MLVRSFGPALTLLLVLGSAPAWAGPREACRGDVERLCKDVPRGGGQIMKCLKEHEAEVSAECKAARAEVNACRADTERLCPSVPEYGGQLRQCLRDHEAQLSAECRALAAKQKEQAQQFQTACQPDVLRYCKDIPARRGPLMTCLKSNQDRLSDACRAVTEREEPKP